MQKQEIKYDSQNSDGRLLVTKTGSLVKIDCLQNDRQTLMIYGIKNKIINNKITGMKEDLTNRKEDATDEPIVIVDECGDTMWDAVLEQDIQSGRINESKTDALLKEIDMVRKFRLEEKESKTDV